MGSGILGLTYAFASIPLPEELDLDSSAEVYDRHDRLIGTFSGEVRRFLIDTDELKPYVGDAMVAAEDRDFYDHNGVSLRGIARAAWANVTGGKISQGGSTITQQYVKNAVLEDPSRTITRKIKEAILSIKLERRYSKRQILGFYLNTIYLGRGAYGIEAAARAYFDKNATELTLSEAAYFAGIVSSPENYQPDSNQKGARARRNRVLATMEEQGFITGRRAERASRGRVRLAVDESATPRRQEAAYFMEWLRKEYLYPKYGNDLYTAGLKIYTTFDPAMQAEAERAIDSVLTEPNDPEAALVSTTPKGEVRAFVGGRDFTDVRTARGFNFASDFPGRQPGSAFKPFTLVTAIEEEDISPQSRFSGASPTYVDECAGEDGIPPWEVENYGGSSYGTITLDQATTNSVNAVYAQLVAQVGPENVAELLGGFGFAPKYGEKEIVPNCSLALGGSLDVTPVEMARAYAGFAARGNVPEIMPIRYITDSAGDCLEEFRPEKGLECDDEVKLDYEQAVEQNSADVLNQTLTHVVQGGTAISAGLPGRPVAGKTGTTQNNVDAWFAGYVPQLVTVVWMGYPAEQGGDLVPQMGYCSDLELCRPVRGREVTGGSFPAQIWHNFMIEATEGMEVAVFPTPVDQPDKVINSPAPLPTRSRSPKDDGPKPRPSDRPTDQPTPTDQPSPSSQPTPLISPSGPGEEEDDP